GAAIHDEPLAAMAHLEGERAAMRMAAMAFLGWNAAIQDHHRFAGLQALIAGHRCADRRPALGVGAAEHDVDSSRVPFRAVVEESELAIAMPQEPHHGGRTLDPRMDGLRYLHSRRLQGCARIDEMRERRELELRAARDMAAIGKDLLGHFRLEQAQDAIELAVAGAQGKLCREQALERG